MPRNLPGFEKELQFFERSFEKTGSIVLWVDVVQEIKLLAGQRGLSLTDVAASIGEDYDNFYAAIKGRSQKRMKEIEPKLRDLIGYNVKELTPLPMVEIPIIGYADAGPGADTLDSDPDDRTLVPQSIYQQGDVGFKIPMDSYSMSPWLMPGDILVVEPRQTPAFGLAMLVRRSDGTHSVKIVAHKNGQPMLESINPNFENDASPFEVIGLVVGYYRDDLGEILYRSSRRGLKPITTF